MNRRTLLLVLMGAVLVAVAGLTLLNRGESNGDSQNAVRAGYLSHPGYLPLFCADQLGFFDDKGIRVELVRFQSSPTMMAAFLSGDIEIVPVATVTALSTEVRDPGRFKVFAISSETKDNYLTSIVTMPSDSSGISELEDLKGKVVGVFPGPAARTLFSLVFEKHGLVAGVDFELRELGPPLHVQALVGGQVNALATYEPYATQAVVEHGAVKLLPAAVETEVLNPTQGGSWLISSKLLSDRPKISHAVIEAIDAGIDYIAENEDSLADIIAAYTSVDEALAGQIPLVTYSKLQDINVGAYQKHADLMTENGVISKQLDVTRMLLTRDK